MERDDQTYYYERAQTELKLAQESELPQAVRAHYTIATRYLDRAYDDNDGTVGPTAVENGEEEQERTGKARDSNRNSSTDGPP